MGIQLPVMIMEARTLHSLHPVKALLHPLHPLLPREGGGRVCWRWEHGGRGSRELQGDERSGMRHMKQRSSSNRGCTCCMGQEGEGLHGPKPVSGPGQALRAGPQRTADRRRSSPSWL